MFYSSTDDVWIGLTLEYGDTDTWTDLTPFTFQNWYSQEPIKVRCAVMRDESGEWNKEGCLGERPFLCFASKLIL